MNATVDANGGPAERLPVRIRHHDRIRQGQPQCAFVIGTAGADNPGCAFAFPAGHPGMRIPARPRRADVRPRQPPGRRHDLLLPDRDGKRARQREPGGGRRLVPDGERRSGRRNALAGTEHSHTPPPTRSRATPCWPPRSSRSSLPSGKSASISKLLKSGGYRARVQAPGGWDRDDRLVLPAEGREPVEEVRQGPEAGARGGGQGERLGGLAARPSRSASRRRAASC